MPKYFEKLLMTKISSATASAVGRIVIDQPVIDFIDDQAATILPNSVVLLQGTSSSKVPVGLDGEATSKAVRSVQYSLTCCGAG